MSNAPAVLAITVWTADAVVTPSQMANGPPR